MRDVAVAPSPSPSANAGIVAPPAQVAGRLRLCATRLARRLRQEAATGLTPSQLALLAVVERDGPLTLGALAESERVAPPTITRVVAKLEEAGFLVRERDARDRRVVRVAITPAARTLLAASRRRKTGWLTARLRELPDIDIAQLDAAVAILERVLEDAP